ncbi:MAG: hypothetical protein K6B68_10760 [Eubacterium sp.]|nr:hypothetical protein [Eubacterium sp.]
MKKNRALLWLIPILIVLIIDIIILASVFKAEFNSIPPGQPGHPTGLATAFAAVVLLIPTVIISAIFIFITIKRYTKLSKHYFDNEQAGIKKKSFELPYNGGKIWCEHLDGMGAYEDEVIMKFVEDVKMFSRPSISSYIIINLDNTDITDRIVETIIFNIMGMEKPIRKIAFVGVAKIWHKSFNIITEKGTVITFLSDYEEAKEWLL